MILYTENQINSMFASHTDPYKKLYIMCHMFVETMLIHKNRESITLKEYFESLIFTCHYIINKFGRLKPEHKEKIHECFMFCLAIEMKNNNLFESEHWALFFVIRRFETIDIELSSENLEENSLLPLLINNIYFDPFNEDGNYNKFIAEKIPFEELIKLNIKLKYSMKVLSKSTETVVNQFPFQ